MNVVCCSWNISQFVNPSMLNEKNDGMYPPVFDLKWLLFLIMYEKISPIIPSVIRLRLNIIEVIPLADHIDSSPKNPPIWLNSFQSS
jgi:hypothetical protein